jgi:hypothetical protein
MKEIASWYEELQDRKKFCEQFNKELRERQADIPDYALQDEDMTRSTRDWYNQLYANNNQFVSRDWKFYVGYEYWERQMCRNRCRITRVDAEFPCFDNDLLVPHVKSIEVDIFIPEHPLDIIGHKTINEPEEFYKYWDL